jgi:hypothetical protein
MFGMSCYLKKSCNEACATVQGDVGPQAVDLQMIKDWEKRGPIRLKTQKKK